MKLLLASGGIDSTVLMHFLACRDRAAGGGAKTEVMFCDYGQASADHQEALVAHHCLELGLRYRREKIDWPEYARGRGHIFNEKSYPEAMDDAYEALKMSPEEYQDYLDNKWDIIQGRNVAFLARAGAYAISRGMRYVYTAFQFDEPEWEANGWRDDFVGPGCDTAPGFVKAFNTLSVSGGFSKPLTVVAPFLDTHKTKRQIVGLGVQLGVDLSMSYSCEFFPACGKCHQCLIRAEVLPTS
jgi:7-cyano-7-deazaguanine synthase in queuosine biosynthesis